MHTDMHRLNQAIPGATRTDHRDGHTNEPCSAGQEHQHRQGSSPSHPPANAVFFYCTKTTGFVPPALEDIKFGANLNAIDVQGNPVEGFFDSKTGIFPKPYRYLFPFRNLLQVSVSFVP